MNNIASDRQIRSVISRRAYRVSSNKHALNMDSGFWFHDEFFNIAYLNSRSNHLGCHI